MEEMSGKSGAVEKMGQKKQMVNVRHRYGKCGDYLFHGL